jgi:hypothetical protein
MIFFASFGCKENTDIPVELYKEEISELENEDAISNYWKKLYELDQNMLKNSKSNREIDSASITNMLRTALLYETHGSKIFNSKTSVPTLNLVHNYISESNLAFWPIIKERLKAGGDIYITGGGYPAYQLEAISFSFYDYSLFNQESKYKGLLNKLNSRHYEKVSSSLIKAYQKQIELRNLETKEILGKWRRQHFKNRDNESVEYFEFVDMSDKQTYLKRDGRLIKLNLLGNEKSSMIYRIENEPFEFHYKLKKTGELYLINEKGEALISYKKHY